MTEIKKCGFESCDKTLLARGLCMGHYEQQHRGKPLTLLRQNTRRLSLADRLDLYTERSSGCWKWAASHTKTGYARINFEGKQWRVHRLVFELQHGAVEAVVEIDHICGNRGCVNPNHLRAVSHKQNAENRIGAQPGTKSGVRGVCWEETRQAWFANVKNNGHNYRSKMYATVAEAEGAAIALRSNIFTHSIEGAR